jgi:hypothetical protein
VKHAPCSSVSLHSVVFGAGVKMPPASGVDGAMAVAGKSSVIRFASLRVISCELINPSPTVSARLRARHPQLRVVERTQTHTNPEGLTRFANPESQEGHALRTRGERSHSHSTAFIPLRCLHPPVPRYQLRYNGCVHTVFIQLCVSQPKVSFRRAH